MSRSQHLEPGGHKQPSPEAEEKRHKAQEERGFATEET